MTTFEWVLKGKVIAIVRGLNPKYMLRLSEALYEGGIDLIEITFEQNTPENWKRTACAIEKITEHMQGRMLVGAGTVLNMEQFNLAYRAKAKYIITPNVNVELIKSIKGSGLCAFPGAMTPSEIETAYIAGADAVKVLPAGVLGTGYIKAVRGPLSHIPLMGVGGIHEKTCLIS